jgi:hypothetical protein
MGVRKVIAVAPPTIDWDAPVRELIASKQFACLYTEERLRAFEEEANAKVAAANKE